MLIQNHMEVISKFSCPRDVVFGQPVTGHGIEHQYGRSLSRRLGGGSFKVELGLGPFNHDPQNRSTLNDLARTVCKIVQP